MIADADTYDIIIVGAGLVGVTLACLIARQNTSHNLRIALVEGGSELHQYQGVDFDPRVVALTQASQDLFIEAGVWSDVAQQRVCAYREMHVWDGEGTASIHFDCADVRQDYLGHIVENSVLLNALRQQLSLYPQISLIQPAKIIAVVRNEKIQVKLNNGSRLNAQLLIAADGAQSKVRELAEFETREWDYGQKAIITSVQTELPHQATAWQRFMRSGPLAFLPLPDVDGKHFCSIVWSAEQALADEIAGLDDAEFTQRLEAAFEHKLGRILGCAERFVIPLRQRHATTYIQPQIVLVGDAAHNIHPLAGQGVNLGLLDAAVLAQELSRALDRGIPLNDFSILRRYQRQRMANNLLMMSAMEAFKRLFGSSSLMLNWLRNSGIRQLDSLAALKKIIVKAAMGLN
ncbi:MAG TPA: UbiH/UbiF/VisC/COQ6 family ubiquinone biosynthesis hydroxylase [Cellvibrio sp.]|nr:UbiH/UbiF/VisC/COQ6 family ubiquinone biosynthesis hydroxylase [Cellvibrio sp.]